MQARKPVVAGVLCGETLLVGSFGRCFDVLGAVWASATEDFAFRRASEVISCSLVNHTEHGVDRHNRYNLHTDFVCVRMSSELINDIIQTHLRGRGHIAVMSRY